MEPYYRDDSVTLFLGDAREITEWTAADVLVTDPPYGMAYESGMGRAEAVANDHDTTCRDDILRMWGGRPALVFGTWKRPKPPETRQVITWWKRKVGPGMGDLGMPWGNATEEIYILGAGWHGRRRPNLIATDDQRGNPYGLAATTGHPTPKPVGLMEQLLECAPPGLVADPFAGSGATLLAARCLGRSAVGVELVERYAEGIARRLQQEVLTWNL